MVTCIFSDYGHVVLVTLVLWHNKFIHPFRQAVCAEVLSHAEHHPLYDKHCSGHNLCVFLMTSSLMSLPWDHFGQQFYTLQLFINCRKSWWSPNQMNHPRARVPPLLLALGISCAWGVLLSIWLSPFVPWFGATEQSGSASHGHLHLTNVGLGSRAVLEHAGRMLTQAGAQQMCFHLSRHMGIWPSDGCLE